MATNEYCNNIDDSDDIQPLNCRYVDSTSFNHINTHNQFSVFHLNIASLAKIRYVF